MSHILDRPAWNALTTTHAAIAEGDERALRYLPSIVPFAAAADNTAENLTALGRMLKVGETMALVEAGPAAVPGGLTILTETKIVQMVGERTYRSISDSRIEALAEQDAVEMLTLATLTKPGPFTLRAQSAGPFWGVKMDGKLIAMAGQRMRQPGFTELSGLCTHPDFQGRGLGKLLFQFVAGEISKKGETVYLHAFTSNLSAIRLYEAMGFRIRSEMNLLIARRES